MNAITEEQYFTRCRSTLRCWISCSTTPRSATRTWRARVHVSPPTCLRRVKRLRDAGLIEREVAILSADRLAPLLGHGLQAVVEITLERQGAGGTGGLRSARRCRRSGAAVLSRLARPGLHPDRPCAPTCPATWRWRSACSPATPTCATSRPSSRVQAREVRARVPLAARAAPERAAYFAGLLRPLPVGDAHLLAPRHRQRAGRRCPW